MTKDEFIKKYHKYSVPTFEAAFLEACKVTAAAKDFSVTVVNFGDPAPFGLMLSDAAEAIGIVGARVEKGTA